MLFNSQQFILGYLPLVVVGFYLIARWKPEGAIVWLGGASLVFYGWDSPLWHVAILLLSIASNYIIGRRLACTDLVPAARQALLILGVTVNLLVIGYFKYAIFIASIFGLSIGDITLPIGISFFSFTQIAFLVDAYRGLAKEYNPAHYLLFVTYFPHLIAGPILHHKEMMPQFNLGAIYRPDFHSLSLGLSFFTVGLAKKIFLADNFAPYADATFAKVLTTPLTAPEAWMGAIAYSLQIYYDFSGYSDMAIGLSRMIGIRLPINFNSPYKSTNIIEFWRRWHMTLSRFLRDYLYFSLGGNRKGPLRRHVNLMATMLLGGLWHGAGWTFVIWGGLHGLYLVINHVWVNAGMRLPKGLGWLLTFLAVVVAWVFFRADNLAVALAMLSAMGGGNGLSLSPLLQGLLAPLTASLSWIRFDGMYHNGIFPVVEAVPFLAAGLLWAVFVSNTQEVFGHFDPTLEPTKPPHRYLFWRASPVWGACLGAALAVAFFMSSGASPFLYFRF